MGSDCIVTDIQYFTNFRTFLFIQKKLFHYYAHLRRHLADTLLHPVYFIFVVPILFGSPTAIKFFQVSFRVPVHYILMTYVVNATVFHHDIE